MIRKQPKTAADEALMNLETNQPVFLTTESDTRGEFGSIGVGPESPSPLLLNLLK